MIGIIFNHDVFDEPYKQSAVEAGLGKLDKLCKKLNRHLFVSWSENNRYGLLGKDRTDEYIVVHYSGNLSDTEKKEIADCIKEAVTLKKSVYKDCELPELLIVFIKIESNDYFTYNLK